jgi:radical SAM protein with 4Fe4S-binding SPASM domain
VFVITGGDPLERADLFVLLEHASGRGLPTHIAPSATPLLTEYALRTALDAGCEGVQLSLDGSTAATHDRFRGVAGTFDRTVAAAGWAADLGLPLSIATTVTVDNADDLPAIARRVEAMGAGMWSVFFLVPTGRGRPEQEVSPARAEEILRWLAEDAANRPFRVKTTEAPQIRRLVPDQAPGGASGIGDGRGFVFVAYNGEVWPSGFLPLPVGNIGNRPLGEIYRDAPLMRKLRDPDALTGPRCGRCAHRALCGGSRSRAYAHTGDPLGDDPLCAFAEVGAAPR